MVCAACRKPRARSVSFSRSMRLPLALAAILVSRAGNARACSAIAAGGGRRRQVAARAGEDEPAPVDRRGTAGGSERRQPAAPTLRHGRLVDARDIRRADDRRAAGRARVGAPAPVFGRVDVEAQEGVEAEADAVIGAAPGVRPRTASASAPRAWSAAAAPGRSPNNACGRFPARRRRRRSADGLR